MRCLKGQERNKKVDAKCALQTTTQQEHLSTVMYAGKGDVKKPFCRNIVQLNQSILAFVSIVLNQDDERNANIDKPAYEFTPG